MENEILLILVGFVSGILFSIVAVGLFSLYCEEDSKKEDNKKEREWLMELPTKQLNIPDEFKTRDERIDRLIKEGWLTIVALRTIVDALPQKSRKEYEKNLIYQLSRSVGGNVYDMEELISLSDYTLIGQYVGKYAKK